MDPISAGAGSIYAAKKGYVPLFLCLPDFPAFTPGQQDLDITIDAHLQPGAYGNVRVAPGKKLTLDGGTYEFRSIQLGEKSSLLADRPATVEVKLNVAAALHVHIGPAPLSANTAHDMIFYVEGADALNQFAWQTKDELFIMANVYAKNGTFSIGRSSTLLGAFIGKAVVIGSSSTLRIDSAFDCPYPPPDRGGR